MLKVVKTKDKNFVDYQKVVSQELYNQIIVFAKELQGLRVLHINATSQGGGVAEILENYIPLLNNLGLKVDWQTIHGDQRFFEITKFIHNSFQNGHEFQLSESQKQLYEEYSQKNGTQLDGLYDLIFVHDPQPLAVPYYRRDKKSKYVWRSHIDTSECRDDNWAYFKPFLSHYDAAIFTAKEYLPANLPIKKTYIIPPAIDPLSPKNRDLEIKVAEETLTNLGLDLKRPIITQISRLDPWKDPIGVVKAYQMAKEEIPGLQLVLSASMADDDPEGWKIYQEVKTFIGRDEDVFLIINEPETNNLNINALQTRSDLIIQKSLREGFGLTVTEGMWKKRPVIGGDTVGIRLQIKDGQNGYLVKSIDQCAEKIIYLLNNPEAARSIGYEAKETVRENFLLPRLIRDELQVYIDVLSK